MRLVLRQGGVGFDFFVRRKTEPASFPLYAETRSRIAGLRYGAGSRATHEIACVFNTYAELRWAVGYPRVLNRGRFAHDDFAAGSHKIFYPPRDLHVSAIIKLFLRLSMGGRIRKD
jgi:hypothetical protein